MAEDNVNKKAGMPGSILRRRPLIITGIEEAATGYILANGAYLLGDLLRGKKKIKSIADSEALNYTPFTSIIIPVYNEPAKVVQKTIDSMASQDYPGYEILIADDSTKPNTYSLPDNCKVIYRYDRDGFKGGALRNAFGYIDKRSELVAIFDADFTVDKDALRHFAAHFKDPNVGAVQGYMKISANEDRNGLTKFLSVSSAASNYILYGRYIRKGFVCVQGTNEVYRKEAIESIGGIAPYTTVNEDLDTSFRLKLDGWKIVYDPKIVGVGLAPEKYKDFAGQLFRWTSSTIREYRRHIVKFMKSEKIALSEKIDSLLFLSTWTISTVVTPSLFLAPYEIMKRSIPDALPLSILMTAAPVITIFSVVNLKSNIKTALKAVEMYFWLLLPGFFVSFSAAAHGLVSDGKFNVTEKESQEYQSSKELDKN